METSFPLSISALWYAFMKIISFVLKIKTSIFTKISKRRQMKNIPHKILV
jgi:hypothetical protein